MFSIVFVSEAQIKYVVGMSTMPKTHGTAFFSYLSDGNTEFPGPASLHFLLCSPTQESGIDELFAPTRLLDPGVM
jgi:hypothetical protein